MGLFNEKTSIVGIIIPFITVSWAINVYKSRKFLFIITNIPHKSHKSSITIPKKSQKTSINGGFLKWGTPKWLVFVRENPTKMDDLGAPLFQETPKSQKSLSFPGDIPSTWSPDAAVGRHRWRTGRRGGRRGEHWPWPRGPGKGLKARHVEMVHLLYYVYICENKKCVCVYIYI